MKILNKKSAGILVAGALLLGGIFGISLITKTHYVTQSGSGSECSQSNPCSLVTALNSVGADEEIKLVGPFSSVVSIPKSGTADNYLNIRCDSTFYSNGILVTGSYVRIDGCTVKNSYSHGIRVGNEKTSFHDVEVINSTVYNSITENGVYPNCGKLNSGWGSGIKAGLFTYNIVFKNNTVYNTCGEGIAVTGSNNATIEGNVVYNNWAVNIYSDLSEDSYIYNNRVWCTTDFVAGRETFGISSGAEYYGSTYGYTGKRDGLKIISNTVAGCYDGISVWKNYSGSPSTVIDALIDDNTISNGYRWSIVVGQGVVPQNFIISNNRIFRSVTTISGVTLMNNVIIGTTLSPITPTVTKTRTPTIALTKTATVTYSPTISRTPSSTNTSTPTITFTITPSKTPTQTLTPTTSGCQIGSKNVNIWVQLKTVPSNQTLRLRSEHFVGNNVRGALYSDDGVLWNVIEIWTDCNSYWGKLGESMWIALKYNGIYFSNWRE